MQTTEEVNHAIERSRLAIEKLRQSERGREALEYLRGWLDGDSLTGLDGPGQTSLANVIMGIWGPCRGSVIDLVRAAIDRDGRAG